MTGVDSEWFLFSVRLDKTFPSIDTEHSGGTVRTESLYLYLNFTLPRRNLASLCPGRREARPRISTPLQHLHEYGIYSGGTVRTKKEVQLAYASESLAARPLKFERGEVCTNGAPYL